MQHFTVKLRQHIIYLTMAGCTLQFSPITAIPMTMLILYNEPKSNNNTIFDGTDYETCYKTNIQISMFLDHHICAKLRLIECTIRLLLLRREYVLTNWLQRDNVVPSCCNVISLLDRAEDSHSVFGN